MAGTKGSHNEKRRAPGWTPSTPRSSRGPMRARRSPVASPRSRSGSGTRKRTGRKRIERSGSPSIGRARRDRRSHPRRAVRRGSTRSRRSSRASRRTSTGRWPSSPIGSASSRMPKPRSGRRISIGARSTSSGGEPARRPWDVAWRSRHSSARSPPASGRATDSRRSWEPPGIGARRSTASARRSRRTSSVSTDRRHRWRSAARSWRPNAVARSRRSRSSTTSSAGSERASSSWRLAGATSRKRPDLVSSARIEAARPVC